MTQSKIMHTSNNFLLEGALQNNIVIRKFFNSLQINGLKRQYSPRNCHCSSIPQWINVNLHEKLVSNFTKIKDNTMREVLDVSAYKKTFIKIVTYGAFTFFILTLSYSPRFWQNKNHSLQQRYIKFPTDLKYILIWETEERRNKDNMDFVPKRKQEFSTGQTMFIKQKCSFINCYITYNKSMLNEDLYYDAVVFDIHQVRHKKIQEVNLTRAPYQNYIFRSMDSAETHYMCSKHFDNFFNMTWTYKLDSDIPHPILNIYNTNNTSVGPVINMTWIQKMKHKRKFTNKIKNKRKAVAWIINECDIKKKHNDFYESLKAELESYNMTITTFGACGDNRCSESKYNCHKVIERDYFFQLVTEESTDKDFVTEKLVKVMQHVTIPIVVGDTDYRSFLPPGGYINANAFDMKKMGSIIDYLLKHKDTYYTYFFDWKNYYFYNSRPRNYVCDLCAKLNDENTTSRTYPYLRKWWNPHYEDICLRNHLYHKFSKDAVTESYTSTFDYNHL